MTTQTSRLFRAGAAALCASVVAGGIFGGAVVSSAPASAQATPPIIAHPMAGRPDGMYGRQPMRTKPERHPQLEIALQQLIAARGHLLVGAHDVGGYRETALHETDLAIAACHRAILYDGK